MLIQADNQADYSKYAAKYIAGFEAKNSSFFDICQLYKVVQPQLIEVMIGSLAVISREQ